MLTEWSDPACCGEPPRWLIATVERGGWHFSLWRCVICEQIGYLEIGTKTESDAVLDELRHEAVVNAFTA